MGVSEYSGGKEVVIILDGEWKTVYAGSFVMGGDELQPALKSPSRSITSIKGVNFLDRDIISDTPCLSR